MDPIVWQPDPVRAAHTHTARFMARHGIGSYRELERRAVADPEWFWGEVSRHLDLGIESEVISDRSDGLPWTRWFTDATVNLSVVCVDRWAARTPDALALVGEREDGSSVSFTFAELEARVSSLAAGLSDLGAGPGQAVAVFLPMSPEAVIAFLAIARLGAVFIPIFSGYGPEAVASRLADPRPAILVCADGFTRRGRPVHAKEVADRAIQLAGGIEAVVVVRYSHRSNVPWTEGRDHAWDEVMATDGRPAAPTGAEDPMMIAYTSGTTGRPKGSVHVHGGFTVKVAEEGAFQTDFHPGDRVMWATDMGWIMGPWIVTAGLANGACVVTYDGAPDHPGPDRLWEIVEKHRLTFLGVSPTLVRALQPHGADGAHRRDLSSLQTFGSTGEPWNPDPWWWLFGEVGGERVPIVNLSGGTEIGACILSVNLLQGIKPCSLGRPSLAMAADVVDPDGRPIGPGGGVGELVVRDAWPGMTRGFWHERERYLATYWDRFPDVWVHGDWASVDEDGFWYLHGRSDDTLNIAGKRIGPAEIESAVVALAEVVMAAAVGVPDTVKGEAIAVYAVPAPGADTDDLDRRISDAVADALGKGFRPRAVFLTADLPRTRSAKIMRRVVKAVALGDDPGDLSSLENPDSLAGIRPL